MDFNLLSSVVLYTLISVIVLFSFKTIIAIKWEAKVFQENFLNMQEQLAFEKNKQEQAMQKNSYLENYNKSLLNNLFEITKELLLTKKTILEERYN